MPEGRLPEFLEQGSPARRVMLDEARPDRVSNTNDAA
jgi:hypothetical protein